MKRIIVLTLLCLVFSACGMHKAPDPFAGDFACEVSFELDGTGYIIAYEKTGERENARLLSPQTLAGLCAVRGNGTVTLSHGEVSFTALAGDKLFGFAECFAPRELTTAEENGGYCCRAENYTLYTDSEGLPLRVVGGRYDLHFIKFKGDESQ